jgi:hypothetical protein
MEVFMKKFACFAVAISIACSLYSFDSSLNGSWGLIAPDDQKEVVIRFNTNEIAIFGELFRSHEYEEGIDTFYLQDKDGGAIIQYYRLAQDKLLFIMTNMDNPLESVILILTKI